MLGKALGPKGGIMPVLGPPIPGGMPMGGGRMGKG
jgi:hypothetical protein